MIFYIWVSLGLIGANDIIPCHTKFLANYPILSYMKLSILFNKVFVRKLQYSATYIVHKNLAQRQTGRQEHT